MQFLLLIYCRLPIKKTANKLKSKKLKVRVRLSSIMKYMNFNEVLLKIKNKNTKKIENST